MFGVFDLFHNSATRFPDKKALVTDDACYTYHTLLAEINKASHGLYKQGITAGTRVGILFRNCPEFIILSYALWKLGACVSFFNFRSNSSELSLSLRVTECEVVIAADEFLNNIRAASTMSDCSGSLKLISKTTLEESVICSYEQILSEGDPSWDRRASVAPDAEVLNIFTGGTTGIPKAAAHTQQGLFLTVIEGLAAKHRYYEDDVFLNYVPFFHISGLVFFLNILSRGASLIIASRFEPRYVLKRCMEEQVTQMSLIPPSLIEKFRECISEKEAHEQFSSVRIVHLSAGTCGEDTIRKVFEFFPHAQMGTSFGMSEKAATLQNLFDQELFDQKPEIASSVGKPAFFCNLRILNDDGIEVAPRQVGELYGKSVSMMSGYRGRVDSFDDDGWFATGDLFMRDEEGYYYFVSRKKDMIKCGGENVYAREIEEALTSHPAVAECAVVGLPDKYFDEIVAAAVVLEEGIKTVSSEELIAFCASQIASYKKPKLVFYVEELPKNSLGKVMKSILKDELMTLRSSR